MRDTMTATANDGRGEKQPRPPALRASQGKEGGRDEGNRKISAFLIDNRRLEMAVSHWKHTMRVRSNRHSYGTPSETIFGDGCRENRPPSEGFCFRSGRLFYPEQGEGQAGGLASCVMAGGITTKGRGGRAVVYSRRLRDNSARQEGDPPSSRLRRAGKFEVMK
jgi:hypothetical protein